MTRRVRFYTSGAPHWWRYQLVSAANQQLPRIRKKWYKVLVDNGAFAYYKNNVKLNEEQHWSMLMRFINTIRVKLEPIELWVILPDYPYDVQYVIKNARSGRARELCESVDACVAVAQAPRNPRDCSGGMLRCYERVAEELASIDWVGILAAPVKLQCSRATRRGRRVIDSKCQVAIAEQVCSAAKQHGMRCHALGAKFETETLKKLIDVGVTSFDTTTWTRPRNKIEKKEGNATLKDTFFKHAIQKLKSAGIPLEE